MSRVKASKRRIPINVSLSYSQVSALDEIKEASDKLVEYGIMEHGKKYSEMAEEAFNDWIDTKGKQILAQLEAHERRAGKT